MATALLAALVEQARTLDARRVWLTSEPHNTAAHAAWSRFGFTNLASDRRVGDVNVTADFKGPGKDRAVYELTLPAGIPAVDRTPHERRTTP